MRQFSLPLFTAFVLLGCGETSPSQPEPPSEQGYRMTATVHVAPAPVPDSTPALVASVVLSGMSLSPVRLTVNHQCPVFLRLYAMNAADTLPAYDEGNKGCTRIGETVEIPPLGSRTFTHQLSLRELREADVAPGSYVVHVVLVGGSEPRAVDAGEVEIP
jgi:hypothetical protein